MLQETSTIFLIGFMGTGKTRLGRKLAPKLGLEFVDLDKYIESKTNLTISQLFLKYGEAEFRHLESNYLHELIQTPHQLISCGGGTPIFHNNMQSLLSQGLVIYLESSIGKLTHRLLKSKEKRPLIASLNEEELYWFIKQKLSERTPTYSQAHITHSTDSHLNDLVENIKNYTKIRSLD